MKKIQTKFLLFILISSSFLLAQKGPSIHQVEAERYKSLHIEKSSQVENAEDIIPFNKSSENNLTRAVFGYYPDWEYKDNAHTNFNYSLLSHIAAFDFTVSSTGQISNPAGWPWVSVINDAHQNGVKIIMVVVNFTTNSIHNLLTDSTAKSTFIQNVKNKISKYKLDGVNIDFEGLDVNDRGNVLNSFMTELTDSVHALDEVLEVSFAAPSVNWGGWNLTGLAQSCDYLFVMGYDFYGSWSENTGPTAPLTSNSPYNIINTIQNEYGTVSTFYPEKLILGVPYYGPHWIANSESEGASVKSFKGATRFRNSQPQSEIYGTKWSSTFSNSWYSYSDGDDYHQVWFDNDSSLALKYDLALTKNLKGVGMWALGYDGARTELWNLINKKFGTGQSPAPSVPADLVVKSQNNTDIFIGFSSASYAESYEVYLSHDAENFTLLKEIFQNSFTIESVELDKPYYIKVRSKNSTGVSAYTEVLASLISTNNDILIVNGFDRIQNTNNTYDFIKYHEKPLLTNNRGFSSCSNEAVFKNKIDINNYNIVIWILLDESTADETFNMQEQGIVKSYLKRGGNLFVSGSEIGWDLQHKGSSSDINFYKNYLKANYIDDAPKGESGSYYSVEAIAGGLFEGLDNFQFDNGTHGSIDVDWPDAIKANNGSMEILKYVDVNSSSGVAGVAFAGLFENGFSEGKVIYLAVPFESIYNEVVRDSVMFRVLSFFDNSVSVDDETQIPNKFVLEQNYPNPFNPITKIVYSIPDAVSGSDLNNVKLTVYDILGRTIKNLVSEIQKPGKYEVTFDGSNLASGTYIYRLQVGSKIISKKMSLIK